MKTYKTFGIAAAAWAALVCVAAPSAAFADDPHDGRIWYIGRASGGDHEIDETLSMDSEEHVYLAGQKVKFKFRLLNWNYDQKYAGAIADPINWYLKWYGQNPEDLSARMQVGVWVNGRRRWAEVDGHALTPVNDYFSDMICTYTVQRGDFGLLTLAAGPQWPEKSGVQASATDPYQSEYSLSYLQNERIVDAYTATNCNFRFTGKYYSQIRDWVQLPPLATDDVPRNPDGSWARDLDMSQAGIYIKTVDFDDSTFADGIWRRIAAGGTSSYINNGKGKRAPILSIPGGVAEGNTVTLYAWTEDKNIATMNPDHPKVFEYTFTNNVKRWVAEITIAPGTETIEIPGGIYALPGATNKETTVFLSATPTNIYRNLDATFEVMITNFVTRTVRVGPPEPPSLVLKVNEDSDYTASATSPAEIVPINVGFEGVSEYTNDLVVTVTASMVDGTSTNTPDKFIGLSTTPSGDPNGPTSLTVLIPQGEPCFLYAYVKRASNVKAGDDDTTAGDKGIRFTASVDAAADEFFSGGKIPATLHIKPEKPIIASPTEGTSFQHVPGGVDHPFTIAVEDAYGFTTSGSKYTVYWSCSGNNIWDHSKPDLSLVGGELTVPIKYITGGEYDSKFYVVNQDGQASLERTVHVQVDAPKSISLTSDRPARKYNEGDEATIGIELSEGFSSGNVGYLFLVPKDEISSNRVSCSGFETGVPIQAGSTTPDEPITMTFLDGGEPGRTTSTLQYTAVLRNNQNFAEGAEIGGFASKQITLTVSNVVPRVTAVSMARSEAFSGYDGIHPTKVPMLIPTDFQVVLGNSTEFDMEPGLFDRTNLVVQWDFYSQAGTWLWGTNTVGNPLEDTGVIHFPGFPAEGTNSVVVSIKDKDMSALVSSFKFRVQTMGTPTISMKAYHGNTRFGETDTGSDKGRIDVLLNVAPTEAITVKVDVMHGGANTTTMLPVLSTYYVEFPPGVTEGSFYLKDMDGTQDSEMDGFRFTASVTNETEASNAGGKTWKEYYTFDTRGFEIAVLNEAPVIAGSSDSTFTNNATLNVPVTIKWGVSDVFADMTNDNLHVTWTVQGEGTFEYDVTNVTGRSYKDEYTFTFTKQGNPVRRVTLQVEDKDGGVDTREYIYLIDPQKPLSVRPLGPATKGLTALSQDYVGLPGRGVGRVWADGSLSKIVGFRQSWNYEPYATVAYVYGYGYRAGEVDNGALQPVMDLQAGSKLGINQPGNQTETAPWYNANALYDSFFYCWIGTGEDGEDNTGNAPGVHLGPLAPAIGTNAAADSGQQRVALGESEDEENPSYPEVSVEAIFSREKYAKDNLGDINADDIPDYYAVIHRWKRGKLFEAAEGTLEDGGDTRDLMAWNEDLVTTAIGATAAGEGGGAGDFLPSMTSASSGSLIPNVQSDWALYGQPFTASMEIRGFGKGLNFREEGVAADGRQGPNTAGAWISDRDFTEVESNAWATVYGEDPDWSPENRTDPTVDDTDGDGLPDGYEYYFWYHAYVGDPNTGKRLEGERFRLEDIAVGEKITSDEIADMFNPNKKDSTSIDKRDSDGDGLTDLEEFAMGTNPIHWDTDGDGISDYWEVMRGLNPLVVENDTTTPNTNPDRDYMAWAEIGKTYAVVTLPDGSMFAVPNNGAGLPVKEDGDDLFLLAEATNNTLEIAIPVYRYGDAKSTLVPKSRGSWSSETKMGMKGNQQKEFQVFTCTSKPLDLSAISWGEGIEVTAQESGGGEDPAAGDEQPAAGDEQPATEVLSNVTIKKNQTLTLVHEQVRAQYGFDPRTAWHMDVNGYCVERWDPNLNPVHARRAGESGLAVHTKPYSNKDEYLLLKYRYFTRGGSSQSDSLDRDLAADKEKYSQKTTAVGGIFSAGTTNPNIRYTDKTYGLSETTYGDKKHGADTDSDGVPDGWELYVGFNPNNTRDGIVEVDGDTLALAREYAGTDSCGVYSNAVSIIEGTESGSEEEVATIYRNHPGNSTGWYNKFFPSDPWSGDTDGDNIDDATEGGSWKNACILNNAMRVSTGDGNSYTFTFIYGEPEDDKSLCIRGGGMNPCSVDTDFDLLPDPWEMSFAGVRAEGGLLQGATFGAGVSALCRRNDGLDAGTTNSTANGMYITGGMDATFGRREDNASFTGDAYTNPSFKDPRTGTIRNFDFDQDGLQNFQEYLTQTLRHLRYDDSETPLMGSWMPDGSPASRKFLGFLPMNIMDGETFYAAAKEAGFVGGGAWQFRELGYFARPPHEWDPTAQIPRGQESDYDATGYRVLLPPHGLAASGKRMDPFGYASTDPRTWDSDYDNMGDYYEIFHGLNPLLGTIANTEPESMPNPAGDVIARAYGGTIAFWCNAWTGWPMLPQDWLSGEAAYRDVDAIKYPWMIGTAEADADGDGIRNSEEALVVNMTSPQPTHTDPTPLWMTDSTALNSASYTSQYYMRDKELDLYLWAWTASGQTGDGATPGFLFSFEENEGYDTDHDWVADGDEQLLTGTPTSDPQKFTDPIRRQTIWFPGENAAAISYSSKFNPLNYGAYDFLRQFTAEAWIRPEDVSRDQVILERVAVYGASTLSNNLAQVRANFRLGIRADGRLYGLFDTSDAVTSGEGDGTAYVLGRALVPDEWIHVALTFNGKALNLYMNGKLIDSVATTKIPANGVISIVQDAVPNMANFPVLGNGYASVPSAIVLGAQVLDVNGVAISDKSTWDSYGAFYKGYLDEVRIWDGARSLSDITGEKKRRYTFEDMLALREDYYAQWDYGATRNDNDGKPNLPPELVAYYNFQTLPGAADSKFVAWEPSGFTKNVRDVGKVEGNNVPGDIWCGWWYETPVRSTVYKNWRIVPWIQNMVGHLPIMDGSTIDSQFWSSYYGGMTPANELGVEKIIFPNTANPYPYYIFMTERRHHEFKLDQMVKQNLLPRDVAKRYQFELNHSIVGSSDLVPIGGAFAKRCDEMWDGNGAADAWSLTVRDNNANGIPDWWEKVAAANYGAAEPIAWETLVTWPDASGLEMTAREAYLRDLARGMVPTSASGGSVDEVFKSVADADSDGLPDWWEDLYGIRSQSGLDDADHDQLSNYAEWLIGECFSKYGFPRVNPLLSQSFAEEMGQDVPDYFLKVGRPYLGEMFADHDFMEDLWEDQFDPDFVSRFMFDAWSDPDGDGWSNWAECRAATDPTKAARLGVDEMLQLEYPTPAIKTTIFYNGDMPFGAMVVQAWHEGDTAGRPDAVWKVGVSNTKEGQSQTSSNSSAAPESARLIGMNPGKEVLLTLGPGAVVPGTVQFMFKDVAYELISAQAPWDPDRAIYDFTREAVTSRALGDAAGASWVITTRDRMRVGDDTKGDLVIASSNAVEGVVGTIDYVTGDIRIDFAKLQFDAEYDVKSVVPYRTYKLSHLSSAYAKVMWTSRLPQQSFPVTFALSDPVLPTEVNSLGHLREGNNIFAAFLDMNGDGAWTPGEPYGVAKDVDVGWSGTSLAIELTDTAPQMFRINLAEAVTQQGFDSVNALTDRGVLGNGAAPNITNPEGSSMPKPTYDSVRVRIALRSINGRGQYSGTYPDDIVFDQRMNLAANPILTEKDLLAQGVLDLEWGTLGTQASNLGLTLASVTRAAYQVILGDGTTSAAITNNSLAVAFVNAFEATRTDTVPVAPLGAIYTQPTFQWTHNNSIGKAYPAFRLRVWNSATGTAAANIVYDSGALPAPPRTLNQDGNYEYAWTAPIYPDMMTPQGQVFATTNNYWWSVSMLDAKYTTPLSSETRTQFRLEASGQLGKISDYGMIKAKVRYLGPGLAATGRINDLIRVQAFTSPDFTGMPAAEARAISPTRHALLRDIPPNAVLLGVKPGTYYLRAFIDTDGDAVCSKWESQGYGNYVGAWDAVLIKVNRGILAKDAEATSFPYTPRPYTVAVGAEPPVVEIYIEDMDSDADHLPDVYEYNTERSLAARTAPTGATFFTKVNTNLATTVMSYTTLNASSSGQTYAPITLMNTLLSGDPGMVAAAIDLFSEGAATENVTVRIDSFSLTDGLALTITPDVQQSEANGETIFTVADSADVKVVLVAAKSPDFADARETTVKTITIKANEPRNEIVTAEELRAAIDAVGLGDAAFFKVRLEQ